MPDDASSASSPDSNYGFLSRLLHKLALDYRFVAETLFDVEQMTSRGAAAPVIEKPVFIAGLARSGTTALLTNIYETGIFRSLTYRDMPFVLMPSLWQKLSGSRTADLEHKERAHGDGILVNAESPEAFEEIFWRVFCGNRYIHDDRLTPHKVSRDTLEKFRQFVGSVLNAADDPRQTRYLSKNNNNLLRLRIIRKAFPDARVIVPFRDPVQQALSLMNQHALFCERHASDPFSLNYMNWLAHHEFGQGHKPFRFDGADTAGHATGELNYWLSLWNDCYRYLLETAGDDAYFLGLERLCEHTGDEVARLYAWADIPLDENSRQANFVLPPAKAAGEVDAALVESCRETYEIMARTNPA